jgi:hypothetical protein
VLRRSAAAKAHAVDIAYAAASELSLLVGAPGFAADSQLAKARRDLNGLLYADGIHDSLYRAVGRTLTARALRPDARVPLPRAAEETDGWIHAQPLGTIHSEGNLAPTSPTTA